MTKIYKITPLNYRNTFYIMIQFIHANILQLKNGPQQKFTSYHEIYLYLLSYFTIQ